jgi:hypothetical protein
MYDKNIYHDGVKNTYYFVEDEKSLNLIPMPKERTLKIIVM